MAEFDLTQKFRDAILDARFSACFINKILSLSKNWLASAQIMDLKIMGRRVIIAGPQVEPFLYNPFQFSICLGLHQARFYIYINEFLEVEWYRRDFYVFSSPETTLILLPVHLISQ